MTVSFLLAPMAALSHRALRELIEMFGACDEYFTEMISAGALISGGPFEAWYTDPGPCPKRLVYQLVGSDPEHLAAAVSLLDTHECAGIDLNMGCSAPAIMRTGAGVRWMASPDRAGALMKLVRKRTKRRLSVKLRIGMEDDFDYLVAFCKRLESEGVERITLHPRTAREKFKRRPRWEYVGLLRAALHIPVAGNGDIADARELVRRAAQGCDAVMVGRLALRAPWVFAQARHLENPEGEPLPRLPERIDLEAVGLRFLELLARYQPQEFHKSRARRFFSYFCDNFTWASYLKTRLARETELSAMAALLSAYCRDHPEERTRCLSLSPGLS
ncbi:MAG: tRNA-dihydrouridine synthase family protein [Treponema sp.]|nr:tRNA-dihydrouridine synthase family protein [Treponema sp.]